MKEKLIDWRGSSLRDIKDDDLFTQDARREAGRQLSQVQARLEPDHWKPFNDVGAGTKEIIIDLDDGWFRVMYVAKFPEAVYVLHCFKKKQTQPASMIRTLRQLATKPLFKKGAINEH